MGFISNTFDKTAAGVVLRDYLASNISFSTYVDFTEVQVFEGATTYPVIILLDKKAPKNTKFDYIKIPKASQSSVIDISTHDKIIVDQSSLYSKAWSFSSSDLARILSRISQLPTLREEFGKCYYGVKTALNEAFLVKNNWQPSEHIKLIYEGKEIKKWNSPVAEQKLILFESKSTKETYGSNKAESEYIELLSKKHPEIFEHLVPFEEKAKKRYDKGEFWWELRNCAYYDLFEKPKIIFPNLQNSNKFCLDSEGVYINAPAVFLPVSNKTLLCVLNSKLIWLFLKSICVVRSGGYIEVKPQYFEQIPIPELKSKDQFEALADRNIESTSALQKLEKKFIKYLQSTLGVGQESITMGYDPLPLSKKLQNWHELAFSDFIKELHKAIKKLSSTRGHDHDGITREHAPLPLPVVSREKLTKSEEMEWIEVFEEKKAEALALKSQIEKTDKEIDALVYELYDLTEEEIEIVENSVK